MIGDTSVGNYVVGIQRSGALLGAIEPVLVGKQGLVAVTGGSHGKCIGGVGVRVRIPEAPSPVVALAGAVGGVQRRGLELAVVAEDDRLGMVETAQSGRVLVRQLDGVVGRAFADVGHLAAAVVRVCPVGAKCEAARQNVEHVPGCTDAWDRTDRPERVAGDMCPAGVELAGGAAQLILLDVSCDRIDSGSRVFGERRLQVGDPALDRGHVADLILDVLLDSSKDAGCDSRATGHVVDLEESGLPAHIGVAHKVALHSSAQRRGQLLSDALIGCLSIRVAVRPRRRRGGQQPGQGPGQRLIGLLARDSTSEFYPAESRRPESHGDFTIGPRTGSGQSLLLLTRTSRRFEASDCRGAAEHWGASGSRFGEAGSG